MSLKKSRGGPGEASTQRGGRAHRPAQGGGSSRKAEQKRETDPRYLINFSYPPRQSRSNALSNDVAPPTRSRVMKKEEFLQANSRMALLAERWSQVDQPFVRQAHETLLKASLRTEEALVEWTTVARVYEVVPTTPQCAICLGPTEIPRICPCGHCFCFVCLVAYFRSRPESRGVAPCPVCQSVVELKQLRPVEFDIKPELKPGDNARFLLLRRSKDFSVLSMASSPHGEQCGDIPLPSGREMSARFNRFHIIDIATHRTKLEKDLHSLQLGSQEALDQGSEDLVQAALDAMEMVERDLNSLPVAQGDLLSQFNEMLPPVAPPPAPHPSQCYYLYQHEDGRRLFLHPLCVQALLQVAENQYSLMPEEISAPVKLIESEQSQSETLMRRYKFLNHLPPSSSWSFVLVDISHMLKSHPKVLAEFQSDLARYLSDKEKQNAARERNAELSSARMEAERLRRRQVEQDQARYFPNILPDPVVNAEIIDDPASFPVLNAPGGEIRQREGEEMPDITHSATTPPDHPTSPWSMDSYKLRGKIASDNGDHFPALGGSPPEAQEPSPSSPTPSWVQLSAKSNRGRGTPQSAPPRGRKGGRTLILTSGGLSQ